MTLQNFLTKEVCDLLLEYATPDLTDKKPNSEAEVSNLARYAVQSEGGRLWRNNVGAAQDSKGNFFRYGLANDSKRMNDVLKSGDLIGIRPVKITSDMVGQTIGQFVSREIKKPKWTYRATNREKAQLAWALLIRSLGGDAAFVTDKGEIFHG